MVWDWGLRPDLCEEMDQRDVHEAFRKHRPYDGPARKGQDAIPVHQDCVFGLNTRGKFRQHRTYLREDCVGLLDADTVPPYEHYNLDL